MKHFLQENDFSMDEIKEIFYHAFDYKFNRNLRPTNDLAGQSWGLLSKKKYPHSRYLSKSVLVELGGHPLILDQSSTQIGRGESIEDTVNVLSRFLDGLIIRTHEHNIIEEFASHSSIPIVNALTDFLHPCQIFADCMTLLEKTGNSKDPCSLSGKKLTFLYAVQYGKLLDSGRGSFWDEICLAGPEEFTPKVEMIQYLEACGLPIDFEHQTDPYIASRNSDVLYTDVWVSMGCESDAEARKRQMSPFQVNDELLQISGSGTLFMHCMPTHPGEEVSESVLASPQSILFDQAENRLHMRRQFYGNSPNPESIIF